MFHWWPIKNTSCGKASAMNNSHPRGVFLIATTYFGDVVAYGIGSKPSTTTTTTTNAFPSFTQVECLHPLRLLPSARSKDSKHHGSFARARAGEPAKTKLSAITGDCKKLILGTLKQITSLAAK